MRVPCHLICIQSIVPISVAGSDSSAVSTPQQQPRRDRKALPTIPGSYRKETIHVTGFHLPRWTGVTFTLVDTGQGRMPVDLTWPWPWFKCGLKMMSLQIRRPISLKRKASELIVAINSFMSIHAILHNLYSFIRPRVVWGNHGLFALNGKNCLVGN